MASTKTWTGLLRFGEGVDVEIGLVAAARDKKVDFNTVNPVTGAPVKQLWQDSISGQVVKSEVLQKGTDFEGKRVVVTPLELKSLLPEAEKAIEIVDVVPVDHVDPLYFKDASYIQPEPGSEGLFELMAMALGSSKSAAIGRFVRAGKDTMVLIRDSDRGLVMHVLYWAYEVRENASVVLSPIVDIDSAELSLAKRLLREKRTEWNPQKYSSRYMAALTELLREKAAAVDNSAKGALKAAIKKERKARKSA